MTLFEDGNTIITMKNLDVDKEYAFMLCATILAKCDVPFEIRLEPNIDLIREELEDEQEFLESQR